MEGEREPRAITGAEPERRVRVITLEGIETREAAEALRGRYLEVEREALPAGTYYWHELVGMTVRDVAGGDLGMLEEVFRAGENEVYRVRGPAGEVLVPALRDVVVEIDTRQQRMVVRLDVEEVR